MAYGWDKSLAVGVPLIDHQHEQLFARLDELLDALRENRGKEEGGKILKFLGGYVVEHFGAEEQLMRMHAYPRFTAHLAQHKQFLASLEKLVAEFEARGPTASLALKLTSHVGDWLRNHIRKTDLELGAFLQSAKQARAG